MPFTEKQAIELHYLVQQKMGELKQRLKLTGHGIRRTVAEQQLSLLKNLMRRAMKKGEGGSHGLCD